MKVLALLALCVGAALGKATRGNAAYTYAYNEPGMNGFYQLFTDYVPNLLTLTSTTPSVASTKPGCGCTTRMWSTTRRQAESTGCMESKSPSTSHRNIRICVLPQVRGEPDYMNVDTWTVFEGPIFTGSEYYGEADAANLGSLTDQGSFHHLDGHQSMDLLRWQQLDGVEFGLYPNTDQDTGSQGQVLNYGSTLM
ncbi:uncharacterized protein LOC119571369 [Penaeus monodon]|uniref:uncharacterized protein LOC119571369 n=1 Tax=Penaeus monodon TaxID=6687 RepID=UPI0018A7385A|nr:uncharacterized protein LOC119571369 [Penaeus monodon]